MPTWRCSKALIRRWQFFPGENLPKNKDVVPTLRVVNSNGRFLLTPREEQVVAKKYLLRIFDKIGISSRVELVLYAMSQGEHRPAEWMPSNNA